MIDPKTVKLLTLALDHAATQGEAESAAVKFVRSCRGHRYTVHDFIPKPGKFASVVFPFGKHRGKTLEEIETRYLEWAILNLTNISPHMRSAIDAELKQRYKL